MLTMAGSNTSTITTRIVVNITGGTLIYNDTRLEDSLSVDVQTGFAVYFLIVLIVGILGNILTLLAVFLNKKLRSAPNYYVANLAFADILCIGVNLPTTIMEFLNTESQSDKAYCAYTSPINIATMICSLVSVCGVGFNRYLLLCARREVYQRVFRKRYIFLSIGMIWIWSFLITIPPMAGYGEFGYHEKFHTCFFKAYDEESWMYGTIFCCALGVFPPVILSSFFYIKIWLKLKSAHQNIMSRIQINEGFKGQEVNGSKYPVPIRPEIERLRTEGQKRQSRSSTVERREAESKFQEQNKNLLRRNTRHKKNIMMLFTIFILILICWMPIAVSFIVDKQNQLPSVVYVFFAALAWTNSSINIFVYAGLNVKFREAYKGLILYPLKKRLTGFNTSSYNNEELGSRTESQLSQSRTLNSTTARPLRPNHIR